jgi:hypothetical protein
MLNGSFSLPATSALGRANRAIRMQPFELVFLIFSHADSEGQLHIQQQPLGIFPIFTRKMESGRSKAGVFRAANGGNWPETARRHIMPTVNPLRSLI